MKTKIRLLIIFIVIQVDVLTCQTTVNLRALGDAPVGYQTCSNTNTLNYGGAIYNGAFWMCGQGCAGAPCTGTNANRSLLKFDMTVFPPNANIISAKLLLYGHPILSHSVSSNSCEIVRVTQPWNEYTVTWSNQPTFDATNHIATLPTPTSSTQDYTIDVTGITQDIIDNPATSDGYMLKLINEVFTNRMYFTTKTNSDTTRVPRLIVTFQCAADTILDVNEDAPIGFQTCTNTHNQNYGFADYLGAFWICGQGCPGQPCFGINGNRSLLRFDLSFVPPGATILDAKLDLFAYSIPGVTGHIGTNNIDILRVTQNWSENTVTWNNQPTTDNFNNVVSLPQSTLPTQDYLNIDVTGIVQDMISNNNDYGFLIKLLNESMTRGVIFGSKDNPNQQLRPKLHVKWTYPCAPLHAKMVNPTLISEAQMMDVPKFELFPNPVSNNLKISLSQTNTPGCRISIINILGQEVYTIQKIDNLILTIDTSSFPNGYYTVKLISPNDQTTIKSIIISNQ